MTDLLITTKPGAKYRSIKWPALYEQLRTRGYSKDQAARISNAQARRRHKALDVLEHVATTGYSYAIVDAVAACVPALPSFKGEQIAPGITRIHGNLCNVHGRYGPCDAAASGKKPKGGKGRKPKKPVKTPEQRAQERQQAKDQNRADVLSKMNIAPDGQEALAALRRGEQPDGDSVVRHGFEQAGLVERGRDGTYRLTASGRSMLSAADAGDFGRAGATVGSGRDRVAARQDRVAAAAERKRQAQAKREQAQKLRAQRLAKRGSGGSSRRTTSPRVERQSAAPKPAAPAKPPKQRTAEQEAAHQRHLARSESARYGTGNNRRNARRHKAINRDDYLVVDDPLHGGYHLPVKKNGKPDHRLMGAAWAALHGGYRGNRYEGPHKQQAIAKLKKLYASEGMPLPSEKAASFQVFKDAAGQYRWVAFSSTAYRDRDGEIVSTKALADDCATADALGIYGPLRWWHVPGLDLGVCDFNAMHGRVLIESGTFKSERIAQQIARAAPSLEISLGFLHPPTEPDRSGVFHTIRRFERSLTPRGKASNLFTSFHVKESRTMDKTKIEALKAIGALTDEDIASLLGTADATMKAADEQGVAYKSEDPEPPMVYTAPDGTQGLIQDGRFVALKATPPVVEEAKADGMGGMGDMESMAEDTAEGGVEEPDDPNALTISDGDIAAIGQAVGDAITQALQPLMGLLDIEKKMQGHVQSMMGAYQTQKDAEQAETKEQIATLETTVKAQGEKLSELVGDQPEVRLGRPSESTATTLNPQNPADAALLESVKSQLPQQAFAFEDLTAKLFGLSGQQP